MYSKRGILGVKQQASNSVTSALPWVGGKASTKPWGKWVASHIPYANGYCEPFAGMLGVLLQREPSRHEIVNDLDGDVYAFWHSVRETPDELEALLANTPFSEQLFKECVNADSTDWSDLRKAWRLVILVTCSFGASRQYFLRRTLDNASARTPWDVSQTIPQLADRLKKVHIYQMDALELLKRLAKYERYVIYADPPYPTAQAKNLYKHWDIDAESMLDVFNECKCKVAISGYPGDPWDELGWRHEDLERHIQLGAKSRKTERLWMNYDPIDTSPDGTLQLA